MTNPTPYLAASVRLDSLVVSGLISQPVERRISEKFFDKSLFAQKLTLLKLVHQNNEGLAESPRRAFSPKNQAHYVSRAAPIRGSYHRVCGK
jgi:hypothetical protein